MKKTALPVFLLALAAAIAFVVLRPREPVETLVSPAAEAAPSLSEPEPAPAAPETTATVAAVPESAAQPRAMRSARAQRFEELLRAPLPLEIASPPEPSAEKSGTPASRPAVTAERPSPPPAPALRSHTPLGEVKSRAPAPPLVANVADSRSPEEIDDGSDVVPPALLSASFDPASVEAGQATNFTAIVSDERTGVRSVSGILRSPAGSMQGFSGHLTDANRFVARIAIPEKAPEGKWVVQMLTLVDNAGNRADLNQAQGALPATAAFEVVSDAPDEQGPTLRSVWLDRPAMRAAEKNTLFVDAADDDAGIAFVHGSFLSPSRLARISFSCRSGAQGVWECPLAPPACLDCGSWQLEMIQVQDKANNSTMFRSDHTAVGPVHVEVSGDRCDAVPPRLTSIALDPPSVSSAQESVVTVRVTMVDEGGCGAKSLSGQMIPPDAIGGQRATVVFRPDGDGRSFTGKMTMQRLAAKGVWTFVWLEMRDEGLNMRVYGATDPALAGATLRVE